MLTQANLLDHEVWTNPDTWNVAMEYTAKKKSKKGSGFWIFGSVCLIAVVVLILGVVYMVNKKK
ncbi:hypothetical protein [Nocardia yamanashiensis]|uniref:hypothetical protein n=1 Tax=Nocardia yamanashiensis TaxID=209247 RepID=UPI0012FD2A19|nr:hypothetical protein [Nocardia yamanashiensis]